MDLLHQSTVEGISCPKGHRWHGQIQTEPMQIWEDPDWL